MSVDVELLGQYQGMAMDPARINGAMWEYRY